MAAAGRCLGVACTVLSARPGSRRRLSAAVLAWCCCCCRHVYHLGRCRPALATTAETCPVLLLLLPVVLVMMLIEHHHQ